MPEYAKLKNAELEALLKERGLPTSGKKADMVDRLTKDDAAKAATTTATATNAEDEIDWDDEGDEGAATTTATAKTDAPVAASEQTAEKAGGAGQPPNPQAVPNQVADIDPAQTDDLTVKPPAEGAPSEEKKEPAPVYTRGLAATNLDEEIERRKKRAEKFGLKIDDDEGLKKLERAKKFGENAPPAGLDEALPERSRKRGREGAEDGGDNKRRGGGRQGGRGRGGRDRRDDRDDRNRGDRGDRGDRGGREPRKEQDRSNGGSSWMSEKDRAAAEARKAKWAKPAA